MSDIFLSYAREDKDKAKRLAEMLAGRGWSVWWDPRIPTGKKYRQVIDEALADARCVVVLWSKHAIESDWVLEEAEDGQKRGILVPVLIEDVQPPRGFRTIQTARLPEFGAPQLAEQLETLVHDIARIAGLPTGQGAASVGRPVHEVEADRVKQKEEERRAQGEAAEGERQQQAGGPRKAPSKWRRTALLLAPLLLASAVVVAVWRSSQVQKQQQAALDKARQATVAAEEETRRDHEARREQEQEAAVEKARQATVVAEEQARRDQEARREQERQAALEKEGRPTPGPSTLIGEMVKIPAGEFWSGCNDKVDQECGPDEKPGGAMTVAAFSIDRTEVTVAEYRQCVEAKKCSPKGLRMPYSVGEDQPRLAAFCNWGRKGRDKHPINCVDWSQAKAYCEWVGKRLPTEVEWEKAARGTFGLKYPWGNKPLGKAGRVANIADERIKRLFPDVRNTDIAAGYDDGYVETAPVGSYPAGASPYGVVDMVGNVAEWVVLVGVAAGVPGEVFSWGGARGGSWFDDLGAYRASDRDAVPANDRRVVLGFRCAQ